jgi:hypothetical protein
MPPFLNTLRRFLPLPEEDQFQTPDFNPMARKRPLPMAGGQMPTVMSDQPQLPVPRPPLPMGGGSLPAQMSPMPDPENRVYTGAPRLPRPSMGSLPMSDARPSMALDRPTMQATPDIPQLPNRPGPAIPDNPIDRARYDYVMRGAKRTPEGGFAGDKIQFKRSGKDIGLAALTGLQQGGILGALTGALGGVIDPMGQRERNFDTLQLPRLEQQRARQLQEEDRLRQQATQELAMRRGQLGIEQEQAQTDLYKAQAQKALNPPSPAVPRPRTTRLTPLQMPDGSTVLVDVNDPENAGKSFAPIPKMPSITDQFKESDAGTEAEFNKNQIIEDSIKGDPEGVKRYMTDRDYKIVTTGTTGEMEDELAEDGKTKTGKKIPKILNYLDIQEAQEALIRAQQLLRKEKERGYEANLQQEKQKRRSVIGGKASPIGQARSTGKKGSVGQGFVRHVATKLGISPEDARRRVEADGYTITQ